MACEGAHINLQVLDGGHLEEALDWSKDLSCCCPAALCRCCCCDLPGKVKVLVLAVNLHMQERGCETAATAHDKNCRSETVGTWKKPWTGAKISVVAALPPCAGAAAVTSQAKSRYLYLLSICTCKSAVVRLLQLPMTRIAGLRWRSVEISPGSEHSNCCSAALCHCCCCNLQMLSGEVHHAVIVDEH